MKTPTKAELLAERQEIIAALAKRDPPQFDEEFPLGIRIEEMVRRETELARLVNRYGNTLRTIVSVNGQTPEGVACIAKQALYVGKP